MLHTIYINFIIQSVKFTRLYILSLRICYLCDVQCKIVKLVFSLALIKPRASSYLAHA